MHYSITQLTRAMLDVYICLPCYGMYARRQTVLFSISLVKLYKEFTRDWDLSQQMEVNFNCHTVDVDVGGSYSIQ